MREWFEFFQSILPNFIQGAKVTLQLTFGGLLLGFVIGLPAAVLRVYGGKRLSWLAVAYIELFRGTPILVQLFVIYFGLPDLGITMTRMGAAVLAMGLNSGAYQAEYFRGAIQAVGGGQMMAARAIGMSRFKSIRHIILPQALRLVIPAWSNEPISLLKASSVAFLIAVPDLMTTAKAIVVKTYDPIGTYLAVAVVYLVLVYVLNIFLELAEKNLQIPGFKLDAQQR